MNDISFLKGEPGEDAMFVSIFSSKGNMFVNGNILTTLTAKVTQGGVDITDTLSPSCFTWVRKSDDVDSDYRWNQIYQYYHSNTLTITGDDVQGSAVFNCVVIIDV